MLNLIESMLWEQQLSFRGKFWNGWALVTVTNTSNSVGSTLERIIDHEDKLTKNSIERGKLAGISDFYYQNNTCIVFTADILPNNNVRSRYVPVIFL